MTDKQLQLIKDRLCAKVHDFARKVAPLYLRLGWTWWNRDRLCTIDERYYIPSERDIRLVLFDLIDNLTEGTEQYCGTGGLQVGFADNGGYIEVSMEFIVGEIDTVEDYQ